MSPYPLTAQFVTHMHDHVVGLVDVAMTRWIQQQIHRSVADGVRRRGRVSQVRAADL